MFKLSVVLATIALAGQVYGDMYLANPRGSNDRLNEANADRNNGNRLFRSENNARGGYCWGPAMTYYEGSFLPVQWTAQHGCNDGNVACNFVFQYMCSANDGNAATQIRDGTTTNTINQANYATKDGNGNFQFGMHESLAYTQACNARQRNKGLFLADQNLNGNSARFTRQENNGGQYGFECNEEENYYPYWHPSPWKDIAIAAADAATQCDYYTAESQNVKAKNYCKTTTTNPADGTVPNNEAACTAANGQWLAEPAFGISAPDCFQAATSRDNHLGNVDGGETDQYNWTIPTGEPACQSAAGCSCAFRMRYNITTSNTGNSDDLADGFIDSRFNGAKSPVKGNPTQVVEGGELTLALNTNQYGRTFQDRSYMFRIAPRPAGVSADTNIYNLNVRGKRGNIVQTFPATEYDYVPTNLAVTTDDVVHMQWTGCDTNPAGNAGEGTDQTDRSNIVQVDSRLGNVPIANASQADAAGVAQLFDDDKLRHNVAYIGQTNCPSYASILAKNGNNANAANADRTNCAKLNAAGPYFNAGLVSFNNTGNFSYMSTRNNNFSNRSQKGTIVVTPGGSGSGGNAEGSGPLTSQQTGGVSAGIIIFVVAAAAVVGVFIYGKKNPASLPGQMIAKVMGGGSNHGYSGNAGQRSAPLLA